MMPIPSLSTMLLSVGAILASSVPGAGPWAAGMPPLWGYGVKSCSSFLAVAPAAGTPTAVTGEEYLRYREWLAGLISGLNLATGADVLRGAELDAALTRVQANCKETPSDDFFNASMRLVQALSKKG